MSHNLIRTAQLSSREDLLRRKAKELEELERPLVQAAAEAREVEAARAAYWDLLRDFVGLARELGVEPQTQHAPAQGRDGGRVLWVEGYPLTGGGIVSAQPLRYCTAGGGAFRRRQNVQEVEELSLFVIATGDRGQAGVMAQQTASGNSWPPIRRLDRSAETLMALQRELEASLLALMSG